MSTEEDANIGRTPAKKRGRPRKEMTVREANRLTGKMMDKGRHSGEMLRSASRSLDPRLKKRLLHLASVGKTTLTVIGYVARFPREEQREMFDVLNRLGSRGAKRYVECLTKPPTAERIGELVARWCVKEFPSLTFNEVIAGVKEAEDVLMAMRAAANCTDGEENG